MNRLWQSGLSVSGSRKARRRALLAVSAAPALALLAFVAFLSSAYADYLYAAAALVCALACTVGFAVNRPARGWLLVIAALSCWAVGDSFWPAHLHVGPVRAEDVFYVAGYPLLIAGALVLTTRGRQDLLRAALDSLIVGIGGGLLVWSFANGSLTAPSSYIEALFPAFDLMVLAALGQGLTASETGRSVAVRLAFAGAGVTLVADTAYAVEVVGGSSLLPGTVLYPLWPFAYALFAWAVLHPSACAVRPQSAESTTSVTRQVTLGIACLSAVAALLVETADGAHLEGFAVVSMVLTLVVFGRMVLLFRRHAIGESALAAVFAHSLDGMLVTDDDRVYVEANDAALEILGRPRDEVIGRRVEDVLGGDPTEVTRGWKAFREAGEQRGVWSVTRGDGREIKLDFVARADYVPGRHLSIVRDVTEKTELEERLRQSQKLEAIGQLAGGVAHDFNNLLTAITGYSQLALADLEARNGRAAARLAEIERAAGRAADLTRQLLAFGRRQILQPETFDLNGAVAEIDSMLRRLLGAHIRIVTSLDPGGCPITADPGQVEQILVNLAVNARDAMPNGGTLVIETEADASSVVLRVTDTGVGMSAATRERAFEPFFTTKPVGEGTGLGLATVHGVVHQSGGTISVASEPNVGTTFEVVLPRTGAVTAPDGREPESPEGGSGRILLVEDETIVRELTTEMLEAQGYEVVAAADPVEALELAGKEHIDALVTDVVMPTMSGRALAARLRDGRPELPIVYISGYSDDAALRDGGLEAGAAFLQKPFGSGDLNRVLGEVLGSETRAA